MTDRREQLGQFSEDQTRNSMFLTLKLKYALINLFQKLESEATNGT